jgi:hypothetical protein
MECNGQKKSAGCKTEVNRGSNHKRCLSSPTQERCRNRPCRSAGKKKDHGQYVAWRNENPNHHTKSMVTGAGADAFERFLRCLGQSVLKICALKFSVVAWSAHCLRKTCAKWATICRTSFEFCAASPSASKSVRRSLGNVSKDVFDLGASLGPIPSTSHSLLTPKRAHKRTIVGRNGTLPLESHIATADCLAPTSSASRY